MSVQEEFVRRKPPVPHVTEDINVDLGKRLKSIRTKAGVTQEALGEAIGVTFQQIQKYEAGANRLHFGKLKQICEVLNISWSYFLDPISVSNVEALNIFHSMVMNRTTMEMVDAFNRITDGKTRRALITMAEKLADKDA